MNRISRSRDRQPISERELALVTPALAMIISGFTPFRLRNLAFGPNAGDTPIIRSAHHRGRLMFSLPDVLSIANAMANRRRG